MQLFLWLKNEGEEYLGLSSNEKTMESVETLLRQHFEFENQVEVSRLLMEFLDLVQYYNFSLHTIEIFSLAPTTHP